MTCVHGAARSRPVVRVPTNLQPARADVTVSWRGELEHITNAAPDGSGRAFGREDLSQNKAGQGGTRHGMKRRTELNSVRSENENPLWILGDEVRALNRESTVH